MSLEKQLKQHDVNRVNYWLFSSLSFLFLMGALYLAQITCSEYVGVPNVCNSLSIINTITPYVLLLLIGFSSLLLIFYCIGFVKASLNPRARRKKRRESKFK